MQNKHVCVDACIERVCGLSIVIFHITTWQSAKSCWTDILQQK